MNSYVVSRMVTSSAVKLSTSVFASVRLPPAFEQSVRVLPASGSSLKAELGQRRPSGRYRHGMFGSHMEVLAGLACSRVAT